jgi:hypothetical protein
MRFEVLKKLKLRLWSSGFWYPLFSYAVGNVSGDIAVTWWKTAQEERMFFPVLVKTYETTRRHKPEVHNNSWMKHLWVILKRKERKLNFSVMLITRKLLKERNEWMNDNRVNTWRTGDADLRFYITTVQDEWRKSAFLTRACFPCKIHLIMQYIEPVSEWSCWRMFIENWPHSELTFRHRASSI